MSQMIVLTLVYFFSLIVFVRDRKELRNNRWKRAFTPEESALDSLKDRNDRKATIVLEHMIQAAGKKMSFRLCRHESNRVKYLLSGV